MDRQLDYGDIIKTLILEWVESVGKSQTSDTDMVYAFDDVHHVYCLTELGWREHRRIQIPFYIVRIVNGKVWIEENRTEEDIAVRLVEAGIPRENIVLGLQPPMMRPHTDYAAA